MATTALEEWRRYPMLPITAALGYATSVIHVYGLGPYIEPICEEFGWSRSQMTVGLTIATLMQALASIPIGMLVDRLGSRLLGLLGVLIMPAAFALISTATGSQGNWYMLWFLLALAALPVQSTVWSGAVASRFVASRGLALAVSLCGASVAAAVFPWMGTKLIAAFGWQHALSLQALIWAGAIFPFMFLFFRGARDVRRPKSDGLSVEKIELAGVGFLEGLHSSVYVRLLAGSLFFTFAVLALIVHFIPILTHGGIDKLRAAQIAGIIGVFSIIGRIGTGLLLDRLRGSLVGAAAFLFPAIGCLVLIVTGTSTGGAVAAAVLIGLTLGAEIDVIVYLTARHFGMRNFGALYGGMLIALSVGTAIGPLAASWVFDVYGGYTPFMWLTIVFMVASSLLLVSLPQPSAEPEAPHAEAVGELSRRPAPSIDAAG